MWFKILLCASLSLFIVLCLDTSMMSAKCYKVILVRDQCYLLSWHHSIDVIIENDSWTRTLDDGFTIASTSDNTVIGKHLVRWLEYIFSKLQEHRQKVESWELPCDAERKGFIWWRTHREVEKVDCRLVFNDDVSMQTSSSSGNSESALRTRS